MKTVRKLASVKPITDIKPIEGADAIECAIVDGGWSVVVKKGEYQIGDNAVYLEIDSWVPHELAPFLSKNKEPREYNGVKGERLSTVKLRGKVSQGLLLPLTVLGDYQPQKGEDLSQLLNIQKWEPPIPAQLAGTMKGQFPNFIPKTDQERCQNLVTDIFETHKDETYEVTVKLDGSSMTVYYAGDELGVCSRNIDLLESEDNTFWKVARQNKIADALIEYCNQTNKEYALQGELIGEGIQGNPEKIKGQQFYVFDIYDITYQRYLKAQERYNLITRLSYLAGTVIEHVPVLNTELIVTQTFNNLQEILDYAEGASLNPKTKREGLVFKSLNSVFTFKAISNSYLLKSK